MKTQVPQRDVACQARLYETGLSLGCWFVTTSPSTSVQAALKNHSVDIEFEGD